MKKFLLLIIFLSGYFASFATHIAGGEIIYTYQGPGATANTSSYFITLKLYRECSSAGQDLNSENVTIGIYNTTGLTLFSTLVLNKAWSGTSLPTIQNNPAANPCLSPPISVCYQVGTFTNTVDLPDNPNGYTLSWIRYTRTTLANLLSDPSSFIGATFITQIPGTNALPSGHNNGAQFVTRDTAAICQSNQFKIDFSATDADGDSLSYRFVPAYDGTGGSAANPNPAPPAVLTLPSLPYAGVYTGTSPLGPTVTINPVTGIISGVAPPLGSYVISVAATEWRNGVRINEVRKDFILRIANCSLTGAELKPNYITCDGFTLGFQNESTSANITNYVWNFGDPASGLNNTSTNPTPTHTYSDTGVYTLKLKVISSGGCSDSTTAPVKIYPGFFPDFQVIGTCFQSPIQFNDKTTTMYGVVDSWRWDFGDPSTIVDTSIIKNPNYKYPVAQNPTVTLIVTNSKGCIDTVTKSIVVNDIPNLQLPFKDTLICSIDTLQLHANGTGVFSWSPTTNMINPTSANPFVFPKDTTTYVVTLNENGCVKKDTVVVNVLQFITVDAGRDTSMCRTDSITLKPVSHALQYVWTPSTYLNNPNTKFTVSVPDTTIKYFVTANLGKCQDRDSVTIYVTPYPQAKASPDTSICFGDRAQIQASIVGSSFTWTPSNTLMNANTLSPIAGPSFTTNYVLAAYDTIGCPKPFRDTIKVTVIPKPIAFAGNDTSIVANQPLQLNATGGASYVWTPTTGMNNPLIFNPIVTLSAAYDSITYKVRVTIPPGCFADDDIKVKVFKTAPDIFIPSAFTPNSDGKNDILRPILVGVRSLEYFRIYNRWGQLVFSTSKIGDGWNGKLAGQDQGTGTFVYMAEATDYLGNKLFRKGTVVLIR